MHCLYCWMPPTRRSKYCCWSSNVMRTSDARFAAFVSAATCSANGRDAVLFTPSLPPRQLPRPPGDSGAIDAPDQGNEPDAAIAVSALLEVRLSQAAEQSADPADRLGCRTA